VAPTHPALAHKTQVQKNPKYFSSLSHDQKGFFTNLKLAFVLTKGEQDSQEHREVFAVQILPKEAPLAVASMLPFSAEIQIM
jgi:hypothetical protein